jgi:hypothetical protein
LSRHDDVEDHQHAGLVSGAVRVGAEVDSQFFGDDERRESLLVEMRSIARG